MDAIDRQRVSAKGFRLFRVNQLPLTITEFTKAGSWKLHSRYDTKAALHRGWRELHENPICIQD